MSTIKLPPLPDLPELQFINEGDEAPAYGWVHDHLRAWAKAYAEEAVRQALVPVRRDRDLLEKLEAWQAVCDRIVDQYGGVVAGVDFAALGRANRVAITSSSSYDWEAVLPKPRTDLRYHGEFIRGWNQCLQEVLAVLSPHTPEPRDG